MEILAALWLVLKIIGMLILIAAAVGVLYIVIKCIIAIGHETNKKN